MARFYVEWRLEGVEADSPTEAAAKALGIQRNPSRPTGIFNVFDEYGNETQVDLDAEADIMADSKPKIGRSLQINRPEWFQDPGFLRWLNQQETPVMTWHRPGDQPSDYSDVVVMVDPSCSGDGPDADYIPDRIWSELVDLCKAHFGPNLNTLHYLVWITNLDE